MPWLPFSSHRTAIQLVMPRSQEKVQRRAKVYKITGRKGNWASSQKRFYCMNSMLRIKQDMISSVIVACLFL